MKISEIKTCRLHFLEAFCWVLKLGVFAGHPFLFFSAHLPRESRFSPSEDSLTPAPPAPGGALVAASRPLPGWDRACDTSQAPATLLGHLGLGRDRNSPPPPGRGWGEVTPCPRGRPAPSSPLLPAAPPSNVRPPSRREHVGS
nr:WAS/WASL-interacting protein family member 2-like [Globicephala melas]